jgi:hypothetical protein
MNLPTCLVRSSNNPKISSSWTRLHKIGWSLFLWLLAIYRTIINDLINDCIIIMIISSNYCYPLIPYQSTLFNYGKQHLLTLLDRYYYILVYGSVSHEGASLRNGLYVRRGELNPLWYRASHVRHMSQSPKSAVTKAEAILIFRALTKRFPLLVLSVFITKWQLLILISLIGF